MIPRMKRWSTSEVPPDRAVQYWRDAIGDALLFLDISSRERHNFSAEITTFGMGPVELGFCRAGSNVAVREQKGIARDNKEVIYLMTPRTDPLVLTQRGRTTRVQPGGSVLIASSEPYKLNWPGSGDCQMVVFPRQWLQDWIATPEDACAVEISAEQGWGHTLASMLRNLNPTICENQQISGSLIADNVANLLSLSVGGNQVAATTYRRALLERIRITLRDRYSEIDCSPDDIAAAHGISRRYLFALFAMVQSTVGSELKEIRLKQAKKMLGDARFKKIHVAEIATRCGFSGPSQFARAFSERFGVSPSAYRATLLVA